MGNNNCIDFDELVKLTEYVRKSDVIACLERNKIRYFEGKNGVWTTLDLMNAAKGLHHSSSNEVVTDKKDLI